MHTILWRPGLTVPIDKDADDVRRWDLRDWVEGAMLASAVVSVGPEAPDPAFVAALEFTGTDYVDVRVQPGGVAPGGLYPVQVAPTITSPGLRLDNFTVWFQVVDQ